MQKLRSALFVTAALTALTGAPDLIAQTGPVPYKLGMFRQGDRTYVGVVVNDSVVVDLSRAGSNAPTTLKELIARWDANLASRIQQIATDAARAPSKGGEVRLSQVKTLPPIP